MVAKVSKREGKELGMNQKEVYNGRYFIRDDGTVWNASGKQLRPGLMSRGYLTVSLYDGSKPKRPKSHLVHRLVAAAFLGESDLQINHKNGNKQDYRLEILEYCTAKENNRHVIEVLGKDQCGESNGRSKLTASDIVQISSSGETQIKIAERFGLSEKHVNDIRRRRYWKSVP